MINNWEEDYKAFVEDIRSNYGEFHPSLAKYVSEFISYLLTKKDQEHKTELESIKGEIVKRIMRLAQVSNLDDIFYPALPEYIVIEIRANKDTIAILDSHINKLSTE